MNHNIKDSYKKIKMSDEAKDRICDEILKSDSSNKKNLHTWKTAVAACMAFALLFPAGTYAAGKIMEYYSVTIKTDKHAAEIITEQTDRQTASSDTSDMTDDNATQPGVTKDKENPEIASDSPHHNVIEHIEDNTYSTPSKYIKVTTDFGKDYSTTDTDEWKKISSYDLDDNGNIIDTSYQFLDEGSDGEYYYEHKNGFEAGKDFMITIIYVDVNDNPIRLYDKYSTKELTINDHKAFLCEDNCVAGTRYEDKETTDFKNDLYMFYDEYGYIINLRAMGGLTHDDIIKLAKKINVHEGDHDNSSRYMCLADYYLTDKGREKIKANIITDDYDPELIMHDTNEKINYKGITYQITDVSVTSLMPGLTKKDERCNIITDPGQYYEDGTRKPANPFVYEYVTWNPDGSLISYERESINTGDGINSPSRYVGKTEKINLKSVNITMKVTPDSHYKEHESDYDPFEVPYAHFFEIINGEYVDHTEEYTENYNRPSSVEGIFMDHHACYFKETSGGKSFGIKEVGKNDLMPGKEVTYHFSYIVDEDFVKDMYLEIGMGDRDYKQICVDLGIR